MSFYLVVTEDSLSHKRPAEMPGLGQIKNGGNKKMIEKLKKALVSRQKKEKKFNKNYSNLQDITNKYLKAIQK